MNEWINLTNISFACQMQDCSRFISVFEGFYSAEFLARSYFVVVDSLPMPDFLEFHQTGLYDEINKGANAITYKNTYYLLHRVARDLSVHFHELVHVAQWKHLGYGAFIARYMTELQSLGYEEAPLEKMAYKCEQNFTNRGPKIDVPTYIASQM